MINGLQGGEQACDKPERDLLRRTYQQQWKDMMAHSAELWILIDCLFQPHVPPNHHHHPKVTSEV